jgi:hypothetical protein
METSDWINALLGVAVSASAFATWRTAKKVEWLTGAMESHSFLMVRLAAKEQGVKCIWWDPTIEAPPPHSYREDAVLDSIRIFLPMEHRQGAKKRRWRPF